MELICKNCGTRFDGKYCINCGQSGTTSRLNLHYLIHEIEHSIFHFDRGIFYTLLKLFTKPGTFIKNYLAGQRVNYIGPFAMVVLLATFYGLVYHFLAIDVIPEKTGISSRMSEMIHNVFTHHYSWLILFTIPFYTLGTSIAFRKQNYNFVEYLVLNCYKAAQRLFLHFFTLPLLYFFNSTSTLSTIVSLLYLLDLCLMFWTNIGFFDQLKKKKVFLLTILSHILFLISFTLVLGVVLAPFIL